MKNKKYLSYIPYIISLLIVVFLIIAKHADNDLFFDIKTGESILKYGIDFKDHFSFIPGLRYIYHHWFYDLVVFFIFKYFKYKGLLVFFYCFLVLLSLLMFKIINENTKNKFLSCIITMLILYFSKESFTTRVQTITYPLFILYIYLLEKLYKTGDKKYTIYLLIISIIINNNHMTMWLLTFIFTLPYLAEILLFKLKKVKKLQFIYKHLNQKIEFEQPKNTKTFLLSSLLLFLSGLITPLKLWPYKFAFVSLQCNDIFNNIIEMQKTILLDEKLALIIIVISFMTIIFTTKKIKFRDLCFIFGLFLLSLIALRNTIYACLILPIIICKYYDFENIKIRFKKIKINTKVLTISISVLLIFVYALLMSQIFVQKFDYDIKKFYPVKITKYIKENTDYKELKFYNDYNYGSYLEFNDIPVLMDSRAEVYIKRFNTKEDILTEFFYMNEEKIETVIDKYDFDYYVVYKNDIFDKYLSKNENKYEMIMEEYETFILYKKIKA